MTSQNVFERVTINYKRYYKIVENDKEYVLPSVTTILSAMTDKSGLDAWKKRVGEKEAAIISKKATGRGSTMHKYIENYLLAEGNKFDKYRIALENTPNEEELSTIPEEDQKAGLRLFNNFYKTGYFDIIENVLMSEAYLYSTKFGGYAGTVDLICENIFDELVIIDFKTSNKPKKKEWIQDYFLQIAAYAIAYQEREGKAASKCQIWIANEEDDMPQRFEISGELIIEYAKAFGKLTKEFHKKFIL